MPQNHKDTKTHQKKFESLSEELEIIGSKIVDAAYTVHKTLGPGLLEKVYEICLCHELTKRGLKYIRQIDIPIVYDGITFQEGLRLDVLVEDKIICEIKAVDLINFNVVNIGQGIKRYVL
ncbi:MAG: GxxExxY protein [Bacteroidota bacterium]|nr:GxxExxY protein [Bacteroidota bacterium]